MNDSVMTLSLLSLLRLFTDLTDRLRHALAFFPTCAGQVRAEVLSACHMWMLAGRVKE